MHYCCNASCGQPDKAAGALLRAARVLSGQEIVRPKRIAARRDLDLARGPARLTACLDINRSDDGIDLTRSDSRFYLASDGLTLKQQHISNGSRVGVRLAADLPWRYFLRACPEVSNYRRHPRAVSV